MKRLILLVAAVFFVFTGVSSYAQATNHGSRSDLQTRLQAEIKGYITQVETLKGAELIRAADLITGTGISDGRLYSVVENKVKELIKKHQASPGNDDIARQLNAMIRTLGSIDPKSAAIIRPLIKGSRSRSVRNRAAQMINKLNWYAKRNKVMQKNDFYQPGQDIMTHRYLNLISSSDSRISRWGAEELNRRGKVESVVYRKMAEILDQQKFKIKDKVHLDSLAWFCKILAKYDSANSAELLNTIRKDARSRKKLRKYAKIRR